MKEGKKWGIYSSFGGIFGRREIIESLTAKKNLFLSYGLCSKMRLPPSPLLFPNVVGCVAPPLRS
jgi:hypothetical protein